MGCIHSHPEPHAACGLQVRHPCTGHENRLLSACCLAGCQCLEQGLACSRCSISAHLRKEINECPRGWLGQGSERYVWGEGPPAEGSYRPTVQEGMVFLPSELPTSPPLCPWFPLPGIPCQAPPTQANTAHPSLPATMNPQSSSTIQLPFLIHEEAETSSSPRVPPG